MTFTARVTDALHLLRAKAPLAAIRALHGSVVLAEAQHLYEPPKPRPSVRYRVIVPAVERRRQKAAKALREQVA